MILSEDRAIRLAHVIIDGIWQDDLVEYSDDDDAIRAAKRAVSAYVAEEGDLEETVKAKILSLKRTVYEGTPEWEALFSRYYQEEMRRRGQG